MTNQIRSISSWVSAGGAAGIISTLYYTVTYETNGMLWLAWQDPHVWPMIIKMVVATGIGGTITGVARNLPADWKSPPPPQAVGNEGASPGVTTANNTVIQETPDISYGSTIAKPAPIDLIDYKYGSIRGIKSKHVTPSFVNKVERMADRLGTKANWLLSVMSFETNGTFDPSITNSIGATGLIQFIPPTARALGTSTDVLRLMSAEEQLDFVETYFSQPHLIGKLGSLEGLYSAVLAGSAVPDANDTLPGFVKDKPFYEANAALDVNLDGKITSGEASALVTAGSFGGVKMLQQKLIDKGAVTSKDASRFADGAFGPKTVEAIKRYQSMAGLEVNGIFSATTAQSLFS